MKIVIAEKTSASAMKLLSADPDTQIVTPEEFALDKKAALADADALIVRSAVFVDDSLLRFANKLKIIGRAGVGVDNIDVPAATRHGIIVMNTPGANAVAVAELAVGLMLSLARHIPRADSTMHAGKWEKKSLQGAELRGKHLGVVGVGRIGIEVAKRAQAFGMTVLGSDPYASPDLAREMNIQLCSLEELFKQADYISLHLGLTQQTTRMIDAAALAKMKKGVRIVNCARGELIDEVALADALACGHVAGAAVDVFCQEPPTGSPLLSAPNVIATPHIGGSTAEAQDAVGEQIARQIREFLLRRVVQNAVNVPSLTDIEYRQLQPYLEASRSAASLLGQIFTSNLEEIRFGVEGPLVESRTELLRNAAVSGVLQHSSQEPVNLVNAVESARERGVRIVELPPREDASPGAVYVALSGPGCEISARASVIHGVAPRLIELNGIEVESPLEGNLVVISNKDVPGVVGRVGTLLGDSGINIARFALGRAANTATNESASSAVAIVQVDAPAQSDVIEELRALQHVIDVRTVTL